MTEIGAPVSVLGTISASQAAKAGDCVVLGDDLKVPAEFYNQGGSSEPSVPVVISTDFGWDQLELALTFHVVNCSPKYAATDVHGYLVDLSDGTRYPLDASQSSIAPLDFISLMGGHDTLDSTIALVYVTYQREGTHMQTPPVVINVGKD